MKITNILLTVAGVLIALVTHSQGLSPITGTVVSNSGEPMPATVIEKGTTNGAISDVDGNFQIHVKSKAVTLTFSQIGFKTVEVEAKPGDKLSIVLHEDALELDELVVVGYGQMKKSDLTSSITSVKGDELKKITTGNPINALQGLANGVQVVNSGGPRSQPSVIIRGATTVNGSSPLYVVDGVPVGNDISFINQNDIASMEILKDASASAIYGTRGSNGVILVTTKKGEVGETRFQFNSSFGFNSLDKPDLADAHEYEKVTKARFLNDGTAVSWNGKNDWQPGEGTDWWDEVVNKRAPIQSYSLSFQGGRKDVRYSGSLGYYNEDSNFDAGYWNRINGRFNVAVDFSPKVSASVDFVPVMESWENTPGALSSVMRIDPSTPVLRPESEWDDNEYNHYARSNNNAVWNPAGIVQRGNSNKTTVYRALINPQVTYKPIENLVIRSQFSVNTTFNRSNSFTPEFFIDNLERNDISSVRQSSTDRFDWNWTNTATYTKTIREKHNFSGMVGYTAEKFTTNTTNAYIEGIPNNDESLWFLTSGTMNPDVSGKLTVNTLLSGLGRFSYNYDNRYYITASVRTDGSSRFPTESKWAVFPAVSGSWRVSKENFMKEVDVITDLKIRAGWGRVGNQAIPANQFMDLIRESDYIFNGDRNNGTSLSVLGNPNLLWETVEDINIGVDLSMLDGRLNIIADVFQKTSHDMLLARENLLILGYPMWNGEMYMNVGSMRAKGWEFSAAWKDKINKLNYNLGLNLSSVESRAMKLAGDKPILTGDFYNDYIINNVEGGRISRFYGYKTDGIFQTESEVRSHTNEYGQSIQPNAKPGDIRYKDLNGDGTLDEEDKDFIGDPFPKLMIGLDFGFDYGAWDFKTNFYGTLGNDIYNKTLSELNGGTQRVNVSAGAYDRAWNGAGSTNIHPRLSDIDPNGNYRRVSDYFIEDGSYFRCRLIQLGYTVPKHLLKGNELRISVSAQNLFTITNYSGLDPERAAAGSSVISKGVDYYGYPNPKTFLLGVNFNF